MPLRQVWWSRPQNPKSRKNTLNMRSATAQACCAETTSGIIFCLQFGDFSALGFCVEFNSRGFKVGSEQHSAYCLIPTIVRVLSSWTTLYTVAYSYQKNNNNKNRDKNRLFPIKLAVEIHLTESFTQKNKKQNKTKLRPLRWEQMILLIAVYKCQILAFNSNYAKCKCQLEWHSPASPPKARFPSQA